MSVFRAECASANAKNQSRRARENNVCDFLLLCILVGSNCSGLGPGLLVAMLDSVAIHPLVIAKLVS
jgi:hypothetical protein